MEDTRSHRSSSPSPPKVEPSELRQRWRALAEVVGERVHTDELALARDRSDLSPGSAFAVRLRRRHRALEAQLARLAAVPQGTEAERHALAELQRLEMQLSEQVHPGLEAGGRAGHLRWSDWHRSDGTSTPPGGIR